MSLKKLKVAALAYGPVSVWYDSDLCEYQVRVLGNPKVTYFTDDLADALDTAQAIQNRLPMGERA